MSGYLFVILFCIMAYSMSQRLAGSGITGDLPTYLVLHIVLVFVLVPLLLLKILIARRYKESHSSLKALGITIFVISVPARGHPRILRTSSFRRPRKVRVMAGDPAGYCSVPGPVRLEFLRKRKQLHASVESSRIAEIPAPATPVTDHKNGNSPMTLLLVQTERGRPTIPGRWCASSIPSEKRFCARPGQGF